MIRNKLWVLLACLVLAPELPAWEYISPDSLNTWISRSAIPFLVDVREHDEYVARHILQAASYPYDSGVLEKRYANLPADRPLVVICAGGGRSATAADFLESRPGAEFSWIYVLQGGMDAWDHDALVGDQRAFAQEQALCEMFTSPSCDICFTANHYIDNEILIYLSGSKSISLPRYRLYFPEPLPDVEDRADYYQIVGVPAMVINGTELIDPLDLTLEKVFYSTGQSTQMLMDIYGSLDSDGESTMLDLRVEIMAGPTVDDTIDYNLFILLTQDELTTEFWDPPFVPSNGETIFNGTLRNYVESDTGSTFTIQPGETRFFDRTITLDETYVTAKCSVLTFVQDLRTRRVYQVDSRTLDGLRPFNSPPSVTSGGARTCFAIDEGDTLSVNLDIADPDLYDKITLGLDSWYSVDSVTYEPYSSGEISLEDTALVFTALEAPVGNYRFDIVGTDLWGLSDTVSLHVSVNDTASVPDKCCDFSGNSVVEVADIISFLLMLRGDPQNPRLDWNRDGKKNIADAVALLLDILLGRCPTPPGAGGLLAAAGRDRYYRPVTPGSLDSEEIEWLEDVIEAMDLDGSRRDEVMAALEGLAAPASLPKAFSLAQNTPNPFNPSTAISFSVPEGGADVSLRVYDLRGRLVRVLARGERSGGGHTVFFDGRDSSGRPLPSGIYLYRLRSGEFTSTRKMLLLK